jgi:eukaryotic-like serine/threonine-protein kinase
MARRADAPHDLLFGLLALQNGMVNPEQLVAAFGVWARAGDRPMADLLVRQGALSDPRRSVLEALAAEHVAMHGGAPEKSLAALSTGRAIRESLARVGGQDIEATLSHVGSDLTERDSSDATASYVVGTSTSSGERFRVLRPHARGGLGEVFVALDLELNREVALKQIQDAHVDNPANRVRFIQEAEITGGLEHPGIVPVYGLGTDSHGRPYYAMRFIRGESLKEAIAGFHALRSQERNPEAHGLELRKLLRRFIDVCNAIEYAHQRGVVHRDLKPGNIIVGRYGETLVVDWGLAKPVGRPEEGARSDEGTLAPSSSSGSAETLPGSVLGTPAYMSPEQAAGAVAELGPRSDVYSLGATLYCVLTGKPPFADDDVGRMLQNVQQGKYAPPRNLDRSVAPALEAICVKAMAKNPADRYGSPRALAEDIELWMADEPVSARREPAAERARRWMRRRRTTVTAAVVAALMALAGLGIVLAVQSQANRDLRRANTRERARFELAMEAIKTYHTGVSEDVLLKQKEFTELRTKLLREAQTFYGRLERLLENQSDRPSRAALGKAFHELGHLTEQVGSVDDALAVHRRALAVRESLASGPGADPESRGDVGSSLGAIANLLAVTGKLDEAIQMHARASAIFEALVESFPDVSRFHQGLCSSHGDRASELAHAGKTSEALAEFERARAAQESWSKNAPDDSSSQRAVAVVDYNTGMLLTRIGRTEDGLTALGRARQIRAAMAKADPADIPNQAALEKVENILGYELGRTGRLQEAQVAYERAIKIEEDLVTANPAVTEYQSDLAMTQLNLGSHLQATGRPDAAMRAYEQSRDAWERLARVNPNIPEFQRRVASTYLAIGWCRNQNGRASQSLAAYETARDILGSLAKAHPDDPQIQTDLAQCHHSLGIVLQGTSRTAEALASYERARGIRERLVKANPNVTKSQADLAWTLNNLGWIQADIRRSDDANLSFKRVIAIREGLAKANPSVTEFQNDLASTHATLGNVLARAGKIDDALAAYGRALTVMKRLASANPGVPEWLRQLAKFHYDAAWSLANLASRPAQAMDEYGQARQILEPLAKANPTNHGIQNQLAATYNNLGELLYQSARWKEALASFQQALAIDEPVAKANPSITQYQDYLAIHHAGMGRVLSRMGHPDEAVAAFRRGIGVREALAKANPTVPGYQSIWAGELNDLGNRLFEAGHHAEALAAYRQAVEIEEPVAKANPKVLQYQNFLAHHYGNMGKALLRTGHLSEAIASYERAIAIRESLATAYPALEWVQREAMFASLDLGICKAHDADPSDGLALCRQACERLGRMPKPTNDALVAIARAHAQIGSLVSKLPPGPIPDPTDTPSAHVETAMRLLFRAVSRGYNHVAFLRSDQTLGLLRDRPDFRALLMDLAFPANPFGAGQ